MLLPFNKCIATILTLFLINIATASSAADNSDIIKSQYDPKDYLTFTLSNQLKVLVISEPKSNVGAASLVVAAGKRNAPNNYLGLPHLLEHAVFLGSKNYPEPSEFDSFVKSQRGWSNGSTTSDATRYHFQLTHKGLEEGLQRLADFIAFPILDEQSIAKARIAVDNEFHGRADDWRKTLAILQQESNPAHPSTKFGIGNAQSLSGDLIKLREQLFKLHKQYYGAQNMTLVVYGKEPVKEIKAMVAQHFSQIQRSNLSDRESTEPLHLPEQLASQIELNIQSDITSLDIRFQVPARNNSFPESPEAIIDNLLGHEAKGSLYAYLKSQGLITRLQTTLDGNRYYGILGLYIQLTDKGLANTDKVIESVFAYINLLKTQPLPNWVNQDTQIAAQRSFDFPAEQEPGDWISDISFAMHRYPIANWLNHKTVFSTNHFPSYLANLTPDKMQLVISRKNVKANKVETIYSTPYRKTKFSKGQLSLWKKAKANKAMYYPAKNPYFATELTSKKNKTNLIVQRQEQPELAMRATGLSLWSQKKTDMSADKVSSILRFYSESNIANSLVRKIRSKVLQNYLLDNDYFARLAGFDFYIESFSSGYTIEVNGYSDNYFDFLQRVTEVFFQYNTSEQAFNSAKKELLYEIDYRKNDSPHWQAERALYLELVDEEHDEIIAKKIKNLSYQHYLSAISTNKKFQLSGLITGNINDKKLLSFADELRINFKEQLSSGLIQTPKVRQLSVAQQKKKINLLHSDASIAFAIQGHDDSIDTQAKFFLANAILQRKYYHHIRTDNSLAYFVHMRQLPTYNSPNIVMVAQSANSSAEQLSLASNDFLENYALVLKVMPEEKFQQQVTLAINKLNDAVFNLNDYTNNLEQELYAAIRSSDELKTELDHKKMTPFTKKQKTTAALKLLTKEEFLSFYHQQIIGKSSKGLLLFSTGEKIAKNSKNSR